jgi:hypothetical protein
MRNFRPHTAEHPRGKPRFEAMPPIELLIRKFARQRNRCEAGEVLPFTA